MLLTADIGTSSFKCALWDYGGNRIAFACAKSAAIISNDNKHEAEPSQWLYAFEECCKKLGELTEVKAIVISGNGPSLVPVSGVPFIANNGICIQAENARLWLDRRAVKYQDKVTAVMGGTVDASFFLPKILYIKNEEYDLYRRTKFFLGCPEYLAYALTGEARNVFPSDGFDRWFWNTSVLDKLELDAAKMPAFIRPGDQFGSLSPQAAEYFGFAKHIPVISGGPDFFAAILGSGVIKPGQACDRTGSSEGINLCTQNNVIDERLMSYGHPIKPFRNLSGIINTSGKAIEWGCSLLGLSSCEDFMMLAQESKPGSGGIVFLPYLAGERAPVWNPAARSIFGGVSLSSGRKEFANSILEGTCFAIRDVITVMEETGETAAQLHVTGGLAGCGGLNQIKADITGREILEGVCREAELLGLAIIGACYMGEYSSYSQASERMVKIVKHYEPNRQNTDLYDHLFEKYKKYQVS